MKKTALIIISIIIGIILSVFYFQFFWETEEDWPELAKCTEAFVQGGKAERKGIFVKPSQSVINLMIVEAKNDANVKADRRCPSICPPVFLLWEAHTEYLDGLPFDSLNTKYVVKIRGSYQCLKPPVGDD